MDPGARLVFTHGLRDSPRSTAFLASNAAPIITDGLEVLVQEVIAAMVTAPWSSTNSVPSASRTGVGELGPATGHAAPLATSCPGAASWPPPLWLGASLAGKVSATASS